MRKKSKRLYCLFRRRQTFSGSFAAALALVLVVGCAKQARISVDIDGYAKLPKPLALRLETAEEIKTVKGYAGVIFERRGWKKRFDAVIIAELPDKIRIDFIDPLAGIVATVISKPGQFTYSDSKGVDTWGGVEINDAFKKKLGLPWGPEKLTRILLGGIPQSAEIAGEFAKDSEQRYWLVQGKYAVSWLDTDEKMKYLELDDGKPFIDIGHFGYQKVKGVFFPMSTVIDIIKTGTHFDINYKDVDLNIKINPGVFSKI